MKSGTRYWIWLKRGSQYDLPEYKTSDSLDQSIPIKRVTANPVYNRLHVSPGDVYRMVRMVNYLLIIFTSIWR